MPFALFSRAALPHLLLMLLAMPCFHPARAQNAAASPGALDGPPRLDMIRDAHIAFADGTYFLTGTAGTFDGAGNPDYDYNRGAPAWRSADLQTWEALGYVWDRVEHFSRGSRPKIGIWTDWSAPANRIDGLLAQATTTPRLYKKGADWFLLCAMNGQNLIIQKSQSGGPEGPYEDYAYLATRGGSPSLFFDDATTYLVFGQGWIMKLNDDLTQSAEEPRLLAPTQDGLPGASRLTLGDAPVTVFKRGDTYFALAPRWETDGDSASCDAILWSAQDVYGPYTETGTRLKGAGAVSVLQKGDGTFHAVSAQAFKESPVILPIP